MKNYETVFILDPALGDDRAAEEIERAKSVIKSAKGEVLDVQRWGKRKLAYEIGKKREGIYTLLRFRGTGDIVSELERSFRMSEPVMRFLTVVDTGEPPAEEGSGSDDARGEGASIAASEGDATGPAGEVATSAGGAVRPAVAEGGPAPDGAAGPASGPDGEQDASEAPSHEESPSEG